MAKALECAWELWNLGAKLSGGKVNVAGSRRHPEKGSLILTVAGTDDPRKVTASASCDGKGHFIWNDVIADVGDEVVVRLQDDATGRPMAHATTAVSK